MTTPDADGWIEWSGGECPVAGEVVVDIRFAVSRHGKQYDDKIGVDPLNWEWQHGKAPLDIVAYRVLS